ncbi:hypothetical protein N431DRAFT_434165 [Stipitochalara longipes BDJ]|nr:hypothetical protein N431DRAFT_434165 [Stipitochalara longipes BDJ]
MADIASDRAVEARSMGTNEINSSAQQAAPHPANPYDLSDDMDDTEAITVSNITNEDAHSLIEPSLSHVASRLKSPQTPALEKAAVMEELDGGGFFDSEVESPPVEVESPSEGDLGLEPPTHVRMPAVMPGETHTSKSDRGLSLGELPPPNLEAPDMPTPWHSGAKPMVLQRGDTPQQSSLHGVFDTTRTRSLSGGAEALRKLLPKGLPSMAQVGNLFGSPTGTQKSKHRGSLSFSKESASSSPARSPNPTMSRFPNTSSLPNARAFESIITTHPQVLARQGTSGGPSRPKAIRRSTSDNSLLYHSLSRASSLGDDTRFEKHTEQVNSRVKAIRDSLQDRSSFRMPQMPSMPSMKQIPSFGFNMNFLTSTNTPWRNYTDMTSEVLPTAISKKFPDTVTKPAIAPGMIGAAISRPEAAIESAIPMTEGSASTAFDRALEQLTGDVVIMGGYRGSILRSTKTKRQVWVPVKVGLNIRKVDLEVGLNPEDEERMPETIYPSGMLQNIGPVDISKRLFKRLSESKNAMTGKLRVHDYGYDWRLSPHLLSRQLTAFLEKLPSNSAKDGPGVLVIAHSLGGLITRHVVNNRPELFSGVLYAGVPKSCVNILGPIRNGDAVLLSSRVLTAQVNFTLRTSFVLLPEDGGCFFDINTREKYPVDFFSVDDWIKYRWSPCTDPPLPPRNPQSGGLGGLLKSTSLLNLPIPGKKSASGTTSPQASVNTYNDENKRNSTSPPTLTTRAADIVRGLNSGGTDRTLAPQMGSNTNPVSKGQSTSQSVSTAVTIPREKAIAYLRRTLAETKKFKQELHFKPELSESNRYPPLALIYGKSIPTVYGAKVDGREGIPCSDVYDNLAFASGDGVCLAREAMLPDGYKAVYGGRISSDRGHVTLLGDLNAVGRALEALIKGRAKGIGKGVLNTSAA